MPSRIEPVEPGESDDDKVNKILKEAETGWYQDSAFFGAMAHQPEMFKLLISTLERFPQSESVSIEILELMRLRIAYLHKCSYCATVRTKTVREEIGGKESAVFKDEIDRSMLTNREETAIRLVDDLTENPHKLTDAFFDELKNEFTAEEIIELLLFACIEIGLDRFTIALELDTSEKSHYPKGLEYPLKDSMLQK